MIKTILKFVPEHLKQSVLWSYEDQTLALVVSTESAQTGNRAVKEWERHAAMGGRPGIKPVAAAGQ